MAGIQAEFVHLDDAWMLESSHDPGFPFEVFQGFGAVSQVRGDDLEGMGCFQDSVQDFEDLTHASHPDPPDDLVLADAFPFLKLPVLYKA